MNLPKKNEGLALLFGVVVCVVVCTGLTSALVYLIALPFGGAVEDFLPIYSLIGIGYLCSALLITNAAEPGLYPKGPVFPRVLRIFRVVGRVFYYILCAIIFSIVCYVVLALVVAPYNIKDWSGLVIGMFFVFYLFMVLGLGLDVFSMDYRQSALVLIVSEVWGFAMSAAKSLMTLMAKILFYALYAAIVIGVLAGAYWVLGGVVGILNFGWRQL